MPPIFIFLPFTHAAFSRKRWINTFKCLDTCFLVATDDVCALALKLSCFFVYVTNSLSFFRETFWIFFFGLHPVLDFVRTNLRLLLKNDPLDEEKCCSRGHASKSLESNPQRSNGLWEARCLA